MRKLLFVMAAVVAMLFTLSGPPAASAEPGATATDGDVSSPDWHCTDGSAPADGDSGGRDTWARCEDGKSDWFGGTFLALGERVWVCDYYPNGHRTHVLVKVSGFPEVALESRGTDNCVKHDLAYPEGLAVMITACSSRIEPVKCHTGFGGRT